MKRWLKRKIPKHPAWRWIVFHILNGRPVSISDVNKEEFVQFIEYAKEADVVDELGLDDLYDHMEEDENEHISQALEIYFCPPMRKGVQNLLLEGCTSSKIAKTLEYKFKNGFVKEDIDQFKSLFFDTDVVNAFELSLILKENRPSPPPTAGRFRKGFATYQEGGDPELDMEDALIHMFTRTFFESEKMFKGNNPVLAMRAQRVAMDIYKALTSNETKRAALDISTGTIPDALDIIISYPTETALSADDIDYDPTIDSGSLEDE